MKKLVQYLGWAVALNCVVLSHASAQGLGGENRGAPPAKVERGMGPVGGGNAPGPGPAKEAARGGPAVERSASKAGDKAAAAKQDVRKKAKDVADDAKSAKPKKSAKSSDEGKQDKPRKAAAKSDGDSDNAKSRTSAKSEDDDKKAPQKAAADKPDSDSDAAKAETRQSKADADSGKREAPAQVKKVELSGEKKKRVGHAFRESKAERHTDVDIHVSIGRRLPSRWHYYPVPVAAFNVVPAYRGYVYVYVDDRYIICEPDTYEVVAIIDADDDYASGGDDRCSRHIKLSADERDGIARSVSDTREVDVRDLDIGWSVPRSIELHRFPDRVLKRNGELRRCRYFVAEDDVAIVDPEEEKVVLLIDAD